MTHNIDVHLGLTNNAEGIVRKIVKSKIYGDPDIILVEFPSYTGIPIVKDINNR